MQEQDIFKNYELKTWEFSPRLYKILAASAIVNIFLFFGLAQANFLTAKSCDTFVMSGVCSVLDAIYVGSSIMDTDTGYVNEDYVKTELEDADITFIDLSGVTPPLEYPSGYFAVANPDSVTDPSLVSTADLTQPNPTLGGYIPGITGNTTNPTITKTPTIKNNSTNYDLTKIKPVVPKKPKTTVNGDLPTNILGDNSTVSENQTTKNPTTDKQTNKNETVSQNIQTSPLQQNINRKPLEDLGDEINAKLEKKEIDLNQNFKVIMNGTLTKEGRLDKKNSKFVSEEGNEQMINVAKSSIEAIGDSGFLIYLKNLNIDKANLTLMQTDEQIYIQIVSDMKNVNSANTAASGLNTNLQALKIADSNGFAKLDESAKLLINNAKITSDGKNFILTVLIPKAEGQAMIGDTLKKRAEKKKQTNSNAESENKTNSETAKK